MLLHRIPLLVSLLSLGVAQSALAQAECPENAIECVGTPLRFEASLGRGAGLDVDTGWFPSGSPVQLRAVLRVDGTTHVRLESDALARWPDAITLELGRSTAAGVFEFDYGLVIALQIRVNVDVLGQHIGGEWTIPIPNLPTDLRFHGAAPLVDLVLPGDAIGEVALEDAIAPITIVKYDALQSVLPIPGLSGGLQLVAQASLESSYRTDRVLLSNDDEVLHTGGEAVFLPDDSAGYGPSLDLWAEAEGSVSQRFVITLKPQIHISFFGALNYDLDLFALPIDLPARERAIDFAPVGASFGLPDLVLGPSPLDFETVSVGESSSQLVELTNAGSRPLRVEVVSVSSGFASSATSRTIPPNSRGFLRIDFTPTEAGRTTGFADLRTNDPDQPLVRVGLSGEAFEAEPPMVSDAGVDEFGDAGTSPTVAGGGCACSVTGNARPGLVPSGAAALLGLLVLVRLRKRTSSR